MTHPKDLISERLNQVILKEINNTSVENHMFSLLIISHAS